MKHTGNEKKTAVFPEKFEYPSGVGYTLDSTPSGTSGFEFQFMQNVVYSSMPTILHVNSAAPPRRNHSIVDPTAKVYNETADYLCGKEYSVDEEPQGTANGRLEVRCSRTGSCFPVRSGAEQCPPGVCADIPDVSNPKRQDELPKMVIHSEALWQCNPGFSTPCGSMQVERHILSSSGVSEH